MKRLNLETEHGTLSEEGYKLVIPEYRHHGTYIHCVYPYVFKSRSVGHGPLWNTAACLKKHWSSHSSRLYRWLQHAECNTCSRIPRTHVQIQTSSLYAVHVLSANFASLEIRLHLPADKTFGFVCDKKLAPTLYAIHCICVPTKHSANGLRVGTGCARSCLTSRLAVKTSQCFATGSEGKLCLHIWCNTLKTGKNCPVSKI
jgi:hypothetical protein